MAWHNMILSLSTKADGPKPIQDSYDIWFVWLNHCIYEGKFRQHFPVVL